MIHGSTAAADRCTDVSPGRRTVGVEEEFLLVDPVNGAARAVASTVLILDRGDETAGGAGQPSDQDASDGAGLESELQAEQLETGTRPCAELSELAVELGRTRAHAANAARERGVAAVALGTHPLPVEPTAFPSRRSQRVVSEFGLTAREQLTCGCHVHVGVAGDEEAVAVLDRIRQWLPVLLACSVNSPFWAGQDSGYASYRSQVWARWPSAGPYGVFGSAAEYRRVTDSMLETATLLDEGMLYLDARVSRRHPTIEVRVADVCLDRDDTVLLAALVRGLVDTAVREWRSGAEPAPARVEELRLHMWRAARSGLDGTLVHPMSGRPTPATEAVDTLLAHVRDALEDNGDFRAVAELVAANRARGTGAVRQRQVFQRTGDLRAVVRSATIG